MFAVPHQPINSLSRKGEILYRYKFYHLHFLGYVFLLKALWINVKIKTASFILKGEPMKFLSILQLIIPFLCAFIMTFFEEELIEAVFSGLVIGWILSAIMGTMLLIRNRKTKITLVNVTSVIAIVPICLYLLLYALASLFI